MTPRVPTERAKPDVEGQQEAAGTGPQVRNILCPVDFSEFSNAAFQYAQQLAWHFRARLLVHHTVPVPQNLVMGTMDPTVTESAYRMNLLAEKEKLDALVASSGAAGCEIVTSLSEGEPITNILNLIQSRNIDLLVMGTHGHKGFNRLVLGSVTERLIHEAACPVLAVPSHPANKSRFITAGSFEPVPLRTILLATDFSSHSDRALSYALRWASEWGGKVVLFHAVEEFPKITQGRVDLFPEYNPAFEQQIARAWEQIRHLVPETAGKACEVNCEVRHGHPRGEVLRVAEEKDADLIVTGARGAGETTNLWGSNSAAIVRAGRFPVLVVRQSAGQTN